MSLFSIIGLYEEMLLLGSYRGIGFNFVDAYDEAGRRIIAFMFPGQDITSFQDLGQFDGDIVFTGILSGDDYTNQADRLRTAFQTPAPATLVHPWLGTLQVVQAQGKPPKFSFKHDELRICTFTATVRRYTPRQPPAVDTLQGLLDSLDDMRTAAYGMLASVLAPVALTLSAISQAESLAGEVATVFGSLIVACASPLVGIAGSLPIGALSGIGDIPFDANYSAAVGALLAGPSSAIAATTTPAIPSAVAPGGSTVTPTPVDGRITAAMILSAASQIDGVPLSSAPIQIPPGPALILSAQTLMLADAMSAASAIGFTSAQEATAWRDQVRAPLTAAIAAASLLVPSAATAASALWRSLVAARAAWIADMTDTIGRLPLVVTFTPPAAAPVWLIAQYLAGDDPSTVVATYSDLIARNAIFHPATPPPGPLEVLAVDTLTVSGWATPAAAATAAAIAQRAATNDLGVQVTDDLGRIVAIT